MKYIKKSAMFGLDARIALAIFGALSIITGATLYSAIQKTKVITTINQLKEVEKALEAFIVDTGLHLDFSRDNLYNSDILFKNSKNLKNWKGPYINKINPQPTNDCIGQPGLTFTCVDVYKLASTYSFADYTLNSCKTNNDSCYYWITFTLDNTSLFKNIETQIDGTETPGGTNETGNFIYTTNNFAYAAIKTSIPFPVSLGQTP